MKKRFSALPVTGVILHRRPYKESSHLCSILTVEYGRIDCVFQNDTPEFYREFQAKLSIKHELPWIQGFRYIQPTRLTQIKFFYLGLYLNELLYWLAPADINVQNLYSAYLTTLVQLEHGSQVTQALRFFEQCILQETGQAIDFYSDANQTPINIQQRYRFQAGEGFIYDWSGRYTGGQVLAAAELDKQVPGAMSLARECLSSQLNLAMNNRPIYSRLWMKDWRQSKK